MRTRCPLRSQLFQRPESLLESGNSLLDSKHLALAGSGSDALSDSSFDPPDIPADADAMQARLEELRARHRELDTTIEQLKSSGGDDISVMALKREKLRVKDRIAWLSSRMMPDIIA